MKLTWFRQRGPRDPADSYLCRTTVNGDQWMFKVDQICPGYWQLNGWRNGEHLVVRHDDRSHSARNQAEFIVKQLSKGTTT